VSENNGSNGGKPDLDALRAEIKQTRAELGETVQALTAKADVKARAKESVEQTKLKVKAQVAEATGKATDALRSATHTATERVRGAATETAPEAVEQVRRNPTPIAAVLIGVVAAVGIILIVRGRRR
jgi:F0F1-type ATP synthase membrane subunit b/b'